MDQREQIGDYTEALQAALDRRQAQIWTAMPGLIQEYDATKQVCTVQVAIKGKQTKKDGTQTDIQLPLLINCPVVFPRGGGYALTFPLKKDDECLVLWANRCIDSWWQSGGVQAQLEFRMHDLSDGFVIPGPTSQPRKLSNVLADGVELRNEEGTEYVRIKTDQMTLKHGTKVVVDTAELHCTGKITADGEIQSGAHTLTQHVHGGVTAGAAQTNTPTG